MQGWGIGCTDMDQRVEASICLDSRSTCIPDDYTGNLDRKTPVAIVIVVGEAIPETADSESCLMEVMAFWDLFDQVEVHSEKTSSRFESVPLYRSQNWKADCSRSQIPP